MDGYFRFLSFLSLAHGQNTSPPDPSLNLLLLRLFLLIPSRHIPSLGQDVLSRTDINLPLTPTHKHLTLDHLAHLCPHGQFPLLVDP